MHRLYVAAAFTALFVALAAPSGALASQRFGTRVLAQGMSGNDVKMLQKYLTLAGFRTPVDGDYGPITASNVRRFERKFRLAVNGVVTTQVARVIAQLFTQARTASGGGANISTAPPPPPPPPPAAPITTPTTPGASTNPNTPTIAVTGLFGGRVLRHGMRGRSIRGMQEFLSAAGFPVTDDGDFGPATTAAVLAFQASTGLKQTGVVNLATANALRAAVAAIDANNTTQKAVLSPTGLAIPPVNAPTAVKEVIAAANQIATLPYIYGGGHASFTDTGYDCSGSTSFALHGAGLIAAPEDSGEMESYGQPGPGAWITLYANGGHVYMNIAGLWFDTAAQSSSNGNDRWSATRISPAAGFVVRHPGGL